MNRFDREPKAPEFKFTPDAERMLEYSQARASSLQRQAVGSDDLLYSLLHYPSAEIALANIGVSVSSLEKHFEKNGSLYGWKDTF